jgi:GDP-L-fucose synthase|tara:strand:- start:1879 stop:2793 length:915 start_codon:yes stop_codon:yes gene_type:complete
LKILIFGSKGMVGSSLVKILGDEKIFQIFPSSRKDTDLFSLDETIRKIDSEKPDIIINAAAMVGGIYANNTKRVDFIINNLKINMNILEASISFPEIKIINLGSSCIYPLNAENPIEESSIMTGKLEPTNSPYAMAKLSAIEIGDAIFQEYGHSITNLMPTNLYGPHDHFSENDSHVIPGMIHKMHIAKKENKESFNIWGSGKPLREFLYVDDLSLAIKKIIEERPENPLINIGSGEEITISKLAYMIKEVIGYQGELKFDKSMPDGNPRKLLNSEIIKNLGWSPKHKLKEGLNLTYEWYLDNN